MSAGSSRRRLFSLSRLCSLLLLPLCLSCGADEVRSVRVVSEEIDQLPRLYVTTSGKEMTAPRPSAEERYYVQGGEIYWPAMTCVNPECPEHSDGDRPYVFAAPDPHVRLENGKIVNQVFTTTSELHAWLDENNVFWPPLCPACAEKFNLADADEETLMAYAGFVVPYDFPETVEKQEQLEKEIFDIRESYRRRAGE